MVTPLTQAELDDLADRLTMANEDRLYKALSPSDAELVLNPQQMIATMSLEVKQALTKAHGSDITLARPLRIGVDGGWTNGWDTGDASSAVADVGKIQCALNL